MNFNKIFPRDLNDSNLSYFLYKIMITCFCIAMLSLLFIFFDSDKAYKYFLNSIVGFLFLGFIRNNIIIKNKDKSDKKPN